MKRLIEITIVYENEKELHVEGLEGTIYYNPEINELGFNNAGNGEVTLNTFYMKTILIDGDVVKGNVDCYC